MKPILIAIILMVPSCKSPTATDDPEFVTSLRFSPSAFDSFRANTEVRYTLKSPATITIYIVQRDSTGQPLLVNTIIEGVYETKGAHQHTWLGDTMQGFFAPSGTYIGILQIESRRFETSVRVFHF